jgi:hypothetical protein
VQSVPQSQYIHSALQWQPDCQLLTSLPAADYDCYQYPCTGWADCVELPYGPTSGTPEGRNCTCPNDADFYQDDATGCIAKGECAVRPWPPVMFTCIQGLADKVLLASY